MARILVTGGAGFIGSHLVDSLVSKGHLVKVIDDLSTGKMKNLSCSTEKISFVEGNILDRELLNKETKGLDAVFHLAALHAIADSIDRPNDYNSVNVNGTVNLLEAMRLNKVRRIVFASSSSVYGNTKKKIQSEDAEPIPISPYALSKLFGEQYLNLYHGLFGLETVSLRFFNVFGPRQSTKSKYACAIPLFIEAMLNGEQPNIFGDGLQSRDFTYVSDVVDGCLAALKADSKIVSGNTLNIANGKSITILGVADSINKILKKRIKPRFLPPRIGEVRHTCGCSKKAKRTIGFECKVSFEDGLKKTIEWFTEHNH